MARILALQTLNAEPDYTKYPCFSASWSDWSIATE
jgi:hypothetical protein